MRIVILGQVRITAHGRQHSVPRAQTRAMLGLLALNLGRPLSHLAVMTAIWGTDPPAKARSQIHTAMSVLRAQLSEAGAPDALTSDRYGYRLDVPHPM